jgi:hypothetical protein
VTKCFLANIKTFRRRRGSFVTKNFLAKLSLAHLIEAPKLIESSLPSTK